MLRAKIHNVDIIAPNNTAITVIKQKLQDMQGNVQKQINNERLKHITQ